MKILDLFKLAKRKEPRKEIGSFSDFFRYASDEEKEHVIREAARKANEDQMRIFEKARLKAEAS